ncbi:TPA: TIGR03759 family integrating conjugative element protein [Salmonella enterica]|uniref:TIGR03759 family integrating conjugative element protein n=1 Tax=Salmonella enterica TaxID=28901 RepID=UPI0009AF4D00|nr:TIGR03759 family integrating conjugative element protein [Salmonella enterica]HBD1844116.1 TIGR03759 family integrating conjugative element protein [Salmonella enterica]
MKMKYLLLNIALLSGFAYAAPQQQSSINESQLEQSQIRDLTRQARKWGLSAEDYQRYESLMAGPRGIQSPGLDPLTALGIEAKNDSERRHFAEMWVKEEFVRTEKELKFQREVNAAWQRMYPGVMPVSLGQVGKASGQNGDGRLALFVRADECAQCDERLSTILASGRSVDIYLVDSQGKDDRLREWAKARNIPVDKVRARQITLNHDAGRWLKFGQGMMPAVLQQEAEGWLPVAY